MSNNGLLEVIPNLALAELRATGQLLFAVSRAELIAGFSGKPTTSAFLNFPPLTGFPTAIAPPRNAPNLFAQPGTALAS